jgi:hypothetical protein
MACAGPPTEPAASSPAGNATTSDIKWQQVVTAVAAAAGGAAWVSAVGSGVVALRLRQADLPVEPVVALMSPEHRFAVGAGILTAPLLAAFIGFLIDWAADRPPREKARTHRRQAIAAASVLVAAVALYVLLKPPLKTFLIESVAVAVTVPIAFHFLPQEPEKRHGFNERLVVFVSVLAAAGAGAVAAQTFGSPSFDEAEITLRDQRVPVSGGYITSTEQSVVLSPACEVIAAVPRDQIARITVGPGEVTRTHC